MDGTVTTFLDAILVPPAAGRNASYRHNTVWIVGEMHLSTLAVRNVHSTKMALRSSYKLYSVCFLPSGQYKGGNRLRSYNKYIF